MISLILNALGLGRKLAEPVVPAVHVDWEARFKKAAADLAKQAEEIDVLKDAVEQAEAQADTLRPDAQKWRDYLKRSRDRKKGVGRG